MTSSPTRRRRGTPLAPVAVRLLVLALVPAVVILVGGPSASAHSDTATFSSVTVQPSGSSVRVDATLTYDNDDDPVSDATVTVAGDNGAGATLVPVVLTGSPEGVYSGTIDLPATGTWRLRLTSVTPVAEVSVDAEVPAPVVSTTAPSTAPPDGGSSSAAAATEAPGPDDESAGGVPDLVTTSSSADGEESSPWVWVLGGIAAAVAVGVGLVFVVRGRRQGPID